MQLQPYTPKELAAAMGAERIQVPGAPGQALVPATPQPPQPPSLLQVFGREVWKRKKLLAIWGVVTAVLAGVVVTTFAKPVYRAEGRLSYRPNYGAGGPRPIYTPPNIQSAVQILKTNDVFEPVRVRHVPGVPPDEFARNVRVEMSRQSEFIDVSYDHPNPAVAAAVANDLMIEGLKYFTDVRVKSTKDAIAHAESDFKRVTTELAQAKADYQKFYEDHQIANPDVELDNLKGLLADIGSRLLTAQSRFAELPIEIKLQETLRDAPAGASDEVLDEKLLTQMNALNVQMQQQKLDDQTLNTARIELRAAREKEQKWRQLKDVIPQAEIDELQTKIRVLVATVLLGEEAQKNREFMQKKYDEMSRQIKSGKPLRSKVNEELDRLKKEEATLPNKIALLKKEQGDRKKALGDLMHLMAEAGPKIEQIGMLRTQMQDYSSQLAATGRNQDPHANDLRVHSPAAAGGAPYSTNAPKLGLALVGVSALLFVGFMSLFGLPKGTFTGPAAGGLTNSPAPAGGLLPRALVALIPVTQKARGPSQPALNESTGTVIPPGSMSASTEGGPPMPQPPNGDLSSDDAPIAEPVNDAEAVALAEPEPVRALAERMFEEGVDHGGIVLFSPTDAELQLAPAIGDLGRYFTGRGERVLVFDARQTAENPTWVQAPGVAASVQGFLNGNTAQSTGCFVKTDVQGVEYSRVDLTQQLSGVLEAKRFQNLVEHMRERYSVVFLVGPPLTLDEDHPMLASLAQGMVLVTETAANPVEVHAYLDTLCQQVPARLYGTLAVPKSAA